MALGLWTWTAATSHEKLSIVGFSYLLIFDALGILNSFVSSVIRTHSAYSVSTTKRSFGARRQEIVFALGVIIYLLFATMYNTKEALEHFLLEGSHGAHDAHASQANHSISFGLFIVVCMGLVATFVSSVGLQNHEYFVQYLRSTNSTHSGAYTANHSNDNSPFSVLLSNVYSLSIVGCGISILLVSLFSSLTPSLDKIIALAESVVMFFLAYPTAVALAKVLLQMTPESVRQGVEARLMEIRQDPRITAIDRVHFWQNTYGHCVGTLEVHIRPEADESSVLWMVHAALEGLTGDGQKSELTVSIIKL
ncbi:cation efflux protein [Spinellus fusiger]|nr:cation efflux protein [Spinellus fusiger]